MDDRDILLLIRHRCARRDTDLCRHCHGSPVLDRPADDPVHAVFFLDFRLCEMIPVDIPDIVINTCADPQLQIPVRAHLVPHDQHVQI